VSTPAPVAIGVDIGGTQLRAATIARDGEVVSRHRRRTAAQDETSLVDALRSVVLELGAELPVGVGIAGLVTPEGVVRYGPNIGVRDLPLAERLHEVTEAPVVVANDGSTAALGEQRVGAGRGHQDVLLATIGTGIGGGVVLGGQVLLGARGFAGELGHLVVMAGGRPCPCGNLGCVEAYASGTAIGVIARERLEETTRPSGLRDLEVVDGPAVSRSAATGDELAIGVLQECGRWLGIALASTVNLLDPEIILVGGGAAADTAPWLLPAARESLAEHLVGSPWRDPPPVELAGLGDDAGVVGAALLAMDRVDHQDPRSEFDRPAILGSSSEPEGR
jgi:glucokinase